MDNLNIKIKIKIQTLFLCQKDKTIKQYLISTAKNGVGNQKNSFKTPLGLHKIKLKIGENCPINTVFKARRPTGEIYNHKLGLKFPNRDWILTRILWLQGLENGINKNINTLKRFIYIHGTPYENDIGLAKSHGCIRMKNEDIIELFDKVNKNTKVLITND